MRAVPKVLLAACCAVLFAVRLGVLLHTVLTPPVAPRDAAAVSLESARAAQRRHASAILAAAADFVDVTLLVLAFALLLRYSHHALPQLRLQPDPLVRPLPSRRGQGCNVSGVCPQLRLCDAFLPRRVSASPCRTAGGPYVPTWPFTQY